MTPEEARALLEGTTPGQWEWRWDGGLLSLFGAKGESVATDLEVQDSDLAAAAPTLAAMIAGMREEWGVKFSASEHAAAHIAWGFHSESSARHYRTIARNTGDETPRIVRRYVTEPEEIA